MFNEIGDGDGGSPEKGTDLINYLVSLINDIMPWGWYSSLLISFSLVSMSWIRVAWGGKIH